MKLLLDVHHSPAVAKQLRKAGYEVIAAADHDTVAVLSDDDLLRTASSMERAVVTENVKDFDRIVRAWSTSGEHHCGVIFTSAHRFPRARRSYPGSLTASLMRMLADPPDEAHDWVRWLD